MLYTIVPPESLYEEDSWESPTEIEIKEGSVSLICQLVPNGEIKITRLISSNPQDYLKPEWQPGSLVPR